MAPNSPHAKTPAMPSPPGSQLTRALATLINFSTIDPAVIILPHNIKNSTTTRANLSRLRNKASMTSSMGVVENRRKPMTAVKKRHMNTGTYVAMQPKRIRRMIMGLDSMRRVS
jgi:hypothetical protein